MNVVSLLSLETIKDPKTHKVKFFADTFMNNIRTWERDKKIKSHIIDARDFKDRDNPMADIWHDMRSAFGDRGIDILLYSGHSDWEGLYVISKYRKGEIPDDHRYIDYNSQEWATIKFNPDADIWLMSCQAGGRFGKKWAWCIAQDIANKTGTTVWAFTSRSAQQQRPDGGYYQKPDYGDFVGFNRKMT